MDDIKFIELLNAFLKLDDQAKKDLSSEFGVSYQEIDKWAYGVSAPEPILKSKIANWMSLHTKVLR